MPSTAGLASRLIKQHRLQIVKYLAHPERQFLVDKILSIALQARGYNNYRDHEESGEAHLVRALARIGALKTCVDVGANVGSFAELLLENGADQVFAFEPHPGHENALRALANEFPGRLSIHESAVGSVSGAANLFFSESALSHASLAEEVNRIGYVSNDQAVRVQVTSIDDFVENVEVENIDFLKIDTEGFEDEVLAGARDLLAHRPPKAILLEFNQHQLVRGHSLLSLSGHLDGFRSFQLLRGNSGVRSAEANTPEANIFHFSNFAFVRNDIADTFLESSRHLSRQRLSPAGRARSGRGARAR